MRLRVGGGGFIVSAAAVRYETRRGRLHRDIRTYILRLCSFLLTIAHKLDLGREILLRRIEMLF